MDVSIVTQSVTVSHSRSLSIADIKSTIDEAGYDIVATPVIQDTTNYEHPWSQALTGKPWKAGHQRTKHLENCAQCRAEVSPQSAQPSRNEDSRPDRAARVTLSVGGMTCASCSNAVTSAASDIPGVSDVAVNLLGNSATLAVDNAEITPAVVSAIEDVGYTAEVVSVEPLHPPAAPKKPSNAEGVQDGPVRVELSVGGMTCASCVNTVTGVLSDIPGTSEVQVNLIGNSATVIIPNPGMAPQLAEAVEDAGYEAEVVRIQPIVPVEESEVVGPRSVSLRISGMFCS